METAFHYWGYLVLNTKPKYGLVYSQSGLPFVTRQNGRFERLQKLCCQAGNGAAFTGRKCDMAKATLAAKGMDQHREGIIRFTHVRGIDLAGV
ncbi:MAG: hypothetical protein EBR53_02530, partial [Actinobacteria bacterium]|nr:hypothetical protein [Actinomycetota bacterium]